MPEGRCHNLAFTFSVQSQMATAEESGIVVRMHYMLAASTLVATPPLVIYFKDCWADGRT